MRDTCTCGMQVEQALHRSVVAEPDSVPEHVSQAATNLLYQGQQLPSAEGITRLTEHQRGRGKKRKVPEVEGQPQEPGKENKGNADAAANASGSTTPLLRMGRMLENGLLAHRAVRARLLHAFLCQILGKHPI